MKKRILGFWDMRNLLSGQFKEFVFFGENLDFQVFEGF